MYLNGSQSVRPFQYFFPAHAQTAEQTTQRVYTLFTAQNYDSIIYYVELCLTWFVYI